MTHDMISLDQENCPFSNNPMKSLHISLKGFLSKFVEGYIISPFKLVFD